MNTYTLESFISFCDDMQIAEEGITINSIKSFLKKYILKTLKNVENIVSKIKNNKIKIFLLRQIDRLKKLLLKTDNITIDNCNEEYTEISNEVKKIEREIEEKVGDDDEEIYEKLHDEINDTSNNGYVVKARKSCGKACYFYDITFTSDALANNVYEELLAANDAETFSDYIRHFKAFKKMIGLPDKCTVYGLVLSNDSLHLYFILENQRLIKRNIDKPLYHTSKNPNLTQLTPQWRAEKSDDSKHKIFSIMSGRYFDSPRIFFGIAPVTRYGTKYTSKDSEYTVYKVEGIRQAYIDIDGMKYGQAVYVETNSPIPVTKVEY